MIRQQRDDPSLSQSANKIRSVVTERLSKAEIEIVVASHERTREQLQATIDQLQEVLHKVKSESELDMRWADLLESNIRFCELWKNRCDIFLHAVSEASRLKNSESAKTAASAVQ